MGKKLLTTPRSRVRASLRQLWLRSRERARALKLASYTCAECGVKQSRAKGKEVYVEVHHTNGIDWDGLIDLIFDRLLQSPEKYTILCKQCHKEHHEGEKK